LAQTIEVNIFDFNQQIYDEMLSVEFVDYLRGDIKFDSLDELKAQLARDKEAALAVFEPS
jgi:FAD synthase